MSLLPGGRTDKTGNEYEKHYLAILLLRLVNGELTSITVEPVGPNKDSVEYTAVDKAGNRYHYQCKLSNGTQNKWRTCDLKEYDVFNRAREIIETDPKNIYVFVSPLSYGRARPAMRSRPDKRFGRRLEKSADQQGNTKGMGGLRQTAQAERIR